MSDHITIRLILLLPLLGAALSYFGMKRWTGIYQVIFSSVVLLLSIGTLLFAQDQMTVTGTWFVVGESNFEVGLWYDKLSGVMILVVAIVALMVSVFSLEYMKHDSSQRRYFSLLGLFAFSMYGIILSSNLLLTFVFWELVGFSSYLLIGFWFEKEEPPISSFKAFIMNRIGDAGFLLGIFVIFAFFKTLDIQTVLSQVEAVGLMNLGIPDAMLFLMGIGLFLAAVGKSAQFPLQTWLPDAMTGPTPVSALIHAATMVAAGVYLMVRVFPLLSIEVLQVVGVVGGITAFMGAFAAFAQNDIKKVLAYSTVSQLGYMIMAIGSGYPLAAFFHLTTHAFFKAGLFLCAGSIIHYFHETREEEGFNGQDLRNMGGLRKILPFTFWVFTICMLSLSGFPLFSGFLSKEMILIGLSSAEHIPFSIVLLGFASVFMTAAYMSRLYFQVFFGTKEQFSFKEANTVKYTLILLAVLSISIVFVINPMNPQSSWLIGQLISITGLNETTHFPLIPVISIGLAVFGFFISFLYVQRHLMETQIEIVKKVFYRLARHNFYIDHFYRLVLTRVIFLIADFVYFIDKNLIDGFIDGLAKGEVVVSHIIGWVDRFVVDGLVNATARTAKFLGNRTRSIQGGNIQFYFVWALFGLLAMFYFLN